MSPFSRRGRALPLGDHVFMPLVVLAVTDRRRQALPWAVALGVAYGFGLDYIFRHILVTDIP